MQWLEQRRFQSARLGGWLLAVGLVVASVAGAADTPPARKSSVFSQPKSVLPQNSGIRETETTRPPSLLSPGNSMSGVVDPGPAINVPVPLLPSKSMQRKQEELRDKRENWMFVSPKDAVHNDDPEKMLGVRDDSETADPNTKYKSVVERFLEKGEAKDDDRSSGSAPGRKNSGEATKETREREVDLDQRDRFGSPSGYVPLNARDNAAGRSAGTDSLLPGSSERAAGSPLSPAALSILSRLPGEGYGSPLSTPDPARGSAFGFGTTAPRLDTAEERKARADQFRQLLNSGPGSTAPLAGPADPINAFGDATRQPVNPVASPGLDAYSRPSAERRTSLFETTPRVGGPDRFAAPSPLTDFGTRSLGSSAFAPTVMTPTPQPALPAPKASGFEPPKRKF
jgi:hypothetical protein